MAPDCPTAFVFEHLQHGLQWVCVRHSHEKPRRWLNPLWSPRHARWRGHLRQYRDPQQAVVGRGKWPRAGSSFGSMRGRTRGCGLALCVFYHEQRFGREICIRRRAAVPCVRRVGHRRAASETYVDARRQVERIEPGLPGGALV